MVIQMVKGLRVSDHLNAIRAIAAVAVLIGHLRSEYWVGYSDVIAKSAWTKLAYGLSDFASDAVCVFFVLSGYFIGASVLADLQRNTFSWKKYLVTRWTRLAIVLIPALLLTASWDFIGLQFPNSDLKYSATESLASFELFPPYPERATLPVFFGNAFFLQCIAVPAFGSNSALWSLSYEWWYYIMAPVLLIAVAPTKNYSYLRIGAAIAVLAILAALNLKMLLCFPMWLLGCLIAVLPQIPSLRRQHSQGATWLCYFGFAAFLVGLHLPFAKAILEPSPVLKHTIIAAGFGCLLYVLLHNTTAQKHDRMHRWSRVTADFSYSLYVLHLPFVICLSPAIDVQPSILSLAEMVAVGLGCYGYSWLMSCVTEAHTDKVRRTALRFLDHKEVGNPVNAVTQLPVPINKSHEAVA